MCIGYTYICVLPPCTLAAQCGLISSTFRKKKQSNESSQDQIMYKICIVHSVMDESQKQYNLKYNEAARNRDNIKMKKRW